MVRGRESQSASMAARAARASRAFPPGSRRGRARAEPGFRAVLAQSPSGMPANQGSMRVEGALELPGTRVARVAHDGGVSGQDVTAHSAQAVRFTSFR